MKINGIVEYLKSRIWIINDTALTLIGLLCFGYCVFLRNFAKLNIEAPYFRFPVFIGEIVLFVCLLFFILSWLITRPKISFWHGVLIAYFVFVLVKALCGYLKWGPLSFRHAALFYYPIFAIFGYYFYRRDFFSVKINTFLFLVFSLIFFGNYSYDFYALLYIALMIILAGSLKSSVVTYIILTLFLLFAPERLLFIKHRALLIGNIVSIIFIIAAAIFIVNIKKAYKIIAFLLLLWILLFAVFKLSDKVALKTLTDISQTVRSYNLWNDFLLKKKDNFKMKERSQIKVYNKELSAAELTAIRQINSELDDFSAKKYSEGYYSPTDAELEAICKKNSELDDFVAKIYSEGYYSPTESPIELDAYYLKRAYNQGLKVKDGRRNNSLREISSAWGNLLFRIFIWKDLLADIVREKPLLGFDFGKPFRSKNIEMLGIADGEWKRDGWIAVHNSYLELIYRAGIVGIILIISLFTILCMMIRQALCLKLMNGILLCAVLINWLTTASFMVILEVPFNAIPFWSLFGMTFAYLFGNKTDCRRTT